MTLARLMQPARRPTAGEVLCFGGHALSSSLAVDFVVVVDPVARCGETVRGVGRAEAGVPNCAACRGGA